MYFRTKLNRTKAIYIYGLMHVCPFWVSWIVNFTCNILISYVIVVLGGKAKRTPSHPLTWFEVQLPTDHFHLGQLGFIQGDVRVVKVTHGVPEMPMIGSTWKLPKLNKLYTVNMCKHYPNL